MRCWLLTILPLLVCTLTFAEEAKTASEGANTWTRFRGPNGTGAVEDDSIPAQWSDSDFNWKIDLPGYGHSSPVVWNDKVFLLSADPKTAARYVLCVSTSGKIKWRKDYAALTHKLHGKSSYACSTPTVDADRVYVAWGDPEHTWFCALDHDGNELWKRDLGGWVGQHGFGSSPVIVGDIVVVTSSQEPENPKGPGPLPAESFVVGLDKRTGDVKWKTPRGVDTASYSVPTLRKGKSGETELIINTTAEGIFALDPATGEQTWSSGKVFSMRTVSSPQLFGDLIYGTTGSGAGGNYLVAYKANNAKVAYEIRKEMPYVPTPILYDDLLFLWSDGGIVTCVKAATGKEVWQERVGGNYSGSPVRAGKKIFCTDEDGTVVVIAAANSYKLLAKNKLGEKSHSTPAISGGTIYVRTVSKLFSISGKKS